MNVYLLFGKTGSGKSFAGHLLENNGILHIDGDKHITNEMRACLENDEQMTEAMIGRFVEHLAKVINERKQTVTQSFVVTQALYLDCYRQKLLSLVDGLTFVLVESDESMRMQRIQTRFEQKESSVSPEYAKQMDKRFERPSHHYLILRNDGNLEQLNNQLKQTFPFFFEV